MEQLIEHPAVQAGLVPLVSALLLAVVLMRTRFAWLAIAAGYASMVAMSTGFVFTPLSASRKVLLLMLLAPVAGLGCDLLARRARAANPILMGASAALSVWVFLTVLAQREAGEAIAVGAGIAVFVALLVGLVLRLRDDGPAAGAAGLGLGLASGIGAILSASTGYFMSGVAVAAASGALLLVQFVRARAIPAGLTGALPIGLGAALFSAASLMLAQLPWYALPLMLLPAAIPALPVGAGWPPRARIALVSLLAVAAAAAPVLAAWLATRGASA